MSQFVRNNRCGILAGALTAVVASAASADLVTIDFSVEDDGVTSLVNGQDVSSPDEFGTLFTLSSSGSNAGAAIFDSSDPGPNDSGGDKDLLVNLGNILILQDSGTTTQTTSGIFDTPNDDADGGSFVFDFLQAVEMQSVTLIDVDDNSDITITLTDGGGDTRTYDVPSNWTNDVESSGNGFDVLDLTSLLSQIGEGGGTATASEDAGFDADDVVQMSVAFDGSGGMDNLSFNTIPGPSALALLAVALGGSGLSRRRRRVQLR